MDMKEKNGNNITKNYSEDNMRISVRAMSRFLIFAVAIIAALSVKLYITSKREKAFELQVKNKYEAAIENLAANVDDIKNNLNKALYCTSGEMLTKLSSEISQSAAAAKENLSVLPLENSNVNNTYKFLSQVGDYTKSLSEKANDGNKLTENEYKNLKTLYSYSEQFADNMWTLERSMQTGAIEFKNIANTANEYTKTVSIDSGFEDYESSFEEYPTLIYDGPFSDHILDRTPQMTQNAKEITEAEALEIAKNATGEELVKKFDENGKMPSYVFENDNTTIAVTKNGGYISYMIRDKAVNNVEISEEDAKKIAVEYLKKLGVESIEMTYYETIYNTCTINFAGKQGDVTLYTDLIKVGVALDDGTIVIYDARGYLVNHKYREITDPTLSENEAQEMVSPLLTVKSIRRAFIPTDGENEAMVYEFKCESEEGENILVYINQDTGKEEKILLLKISASGMLTV